MNDTRRPVYVDRRPPAAHDNSPKLLGLGMVTALVIMAMGVLFWLMAATDDRGGVDQAAEGDQPLASAAPAAPAPSEEPTPEPTPTPTPVTVPPAPSESQLSSNEWLLAQYAIVKEDGNLTVVGTVQNLASAQRSATIRVFVYSDGLHIATGTGQVSGVPGGGTTQVSLPSGTPWKAGDVLLVEAEDL